MTDYLVRPNEPQQIFSPLPSDNIATLLIVNSGVTKLTLSNNRNDTTNALTLVPYDNVTLDPTKAWYVQTPSGETQLGTVTVKTNASGLVSPANAAQMALAAGSRQSDTNASLIYSETSRTGPFTSPVFDVSQYNSFQLKCQDEQPNAYPFKSGGVVLEWAVDATFNNIVMVHTLEIASINTIPPDYGGQSGYTLVSDRMHGPYMRYRATNTVGTTVQSIKLWGSTRQVSVFRARENSPSTFDAGTDNVLAMVNQNLAVVPPNTGWQVPVRMGAGRVTIGIAAYGGGGFTPSNNVFCQLWSPQGGSGRKIWQKRIVGATNWSVDNIQLPKRTLVLELSNLDTVNSFNVAGSIVAES